MRTDAKVVEATDVGFTLSNGERIAAGLKVWAAGIKAPEVLSTIDGLEHSRTGRLLVRQTLQTSRDETIFALGGCSESASGDTAPPNAQAARQQALFLARHLPNWPFKKPLPSFRYRVRGSIVSLADYNGWGTLGHYALGGGKLHGFMLRAVHMLLFRQHQIELLGLLRGLATWASDKFYFLFRPPIRLD